ncbi:hypothetical protein L9F63_017779, partial [Diploptera punctata]
CRTLKTSIMFSTSLYTTKITEVVLSLRILGNFLPILRKRRLSCMTRKEHYEPNTQIGECTPEPCHPFNGKPTGGCCRYGYSLGLAALCMRLADIQLTASQQFQTLPARYTCVKSNKMTQICYTQIYKMAV